MSEEFIPQTQHQVTERDLEYVNQALRSDRLTQGRFTEALEQRLCDYTGAQFAVACSSCTTALTLAFLAAEVQGQEVLVPSLTFTATAQAVRLAGGMVKLRDIYRDALTMDPEFFSSQIFMAPVDFAGLPYGENPVDFVVVADAAHSLGATVDGRKVGTLADMTCLSFHATKLVTCGEGGAVLTDDGAYAGRLRPLRDWGRADGLTAHLGLSGHLSEAQAALALSQLERIDELLERRQAVWQRYANAFREVPGVETQRIPDGYTHAAHLFVLWLDLEMYDRDNFRERLQARGIGTQIHYRPLHRQPLYQANPNLFPVSEQFWQGCVSLPLFNGIADEQVARVIDVAQEELEHARQG